jgi:hypothetical protein
MLPGLTNDDRPFPVGYWQFPTTLLPACDGVPSGNVQRSNRFPNSTYFRNWTSTDDLLKWDIEVANAGQYGVTIYYACPADDVGARFEVEFLGNRLQGRIGRAMIVSHGRKGLPRISNRWQWAR